jgi:2-iminobutanoate/2-iminopropanoate deaminase
MVEPQNSLKIERIVCQSLTKPLPIYAHATISQGFVFVSGIQGFTNGFSLPEDLREESKNVMENLGKVLTQCGCSYDNIVRLNLFLRKLSDFPIVNEEINQGIVSLLSLTSFHLFI